MRIKEGKKEEDILKAAIDVFAEQSYHCAKISEIAERAGVATGSVYLYFESKEDLLNKIFENLWTDILTNLNVIKDDTKLNPVQKFNSLVEAIFSVFPKNPSLAIVFVNEQNTVILEEDNKFRLLYDNFLNIGGVIIREGIEKGFFSEKLNLQVLRHFTFGAIRNTLHQWAKNPDELPLMMICEQIKLLLLKGIAK
jgi:TetR/AcrR family fatty acid metabolism transcriptional regulator